jgi:hypothetical protein
MSTLSRSALAVSLLLVVSACSGQKQQNAAQKSIASKDDVTFMYFPQNDSDLDLSERQVCFRTDFINDAGLTISHTHHKKSVPFAAYLAQIEETLEDKESAEKQAKMTTAEKVVTAVALATVQALIAPIYFAGVLVQKVKPKADTKPAVKPPSQFQIQLDKQLIKTLANKLSDKNTTHEANSEAEKLTYVSVISLWNNIESKKFVLNEDERVSCEK